MFFNNCRWSDDASLVIVGELNTIGHCNDRVTFPKLVNIHIGRLQKQLHVWWLSLYLSLSTYTPVITIHGYNGINIIKDNILLIIIQPKTRNLSNFILIFSSFNSIVPSLLCVHIQNNYIKSKFSQYFLGYLASSGENNSGCNHRKQGTQFNVQRKLGICSNLEDNTQRCNCQSGVRKRGINAVNNL